MDFEVGGGGGQNSPYPIDFARGPYALPRAAFWYLYDLTAMNKGASRGFVSIS